MRQIRQRHNTNFDQYLAEQLYCDVGETDMVNELIIESPRLPNQTGEKDDGLAVEPISMARQPPTHLEPSELGTKE